MLSVEEAQERILSFFHVLEPEEKPILDALGQVLAEDVVSGFDIPPLANSAMDGYAVQADSLRGASPTSPVVLKVVGSVAAGQMPRDEVTPGTAVRIMTGAPVPRGADAVVPFEDTDEADRRDTPNGLSHIGVRVEIESGNDIRPAGQDVEKGQRVLEKGTVLRPAEVGVLASLGRERVRVVRRPVAAILATGDELLEVGEAYDQGRIYNSNSFSLAAGVLRYGGVPKLLGIARDNLDSMRSKLREGMESDILITSAGPERTGCAQTTMISFAP